jgi:Ca2+-binding RTX toxin-like protein
MRTVVSPVVSSLEPRIMLFSFTLTNGTLRLTGDTTSQALIVSLNGNNIQATLSEGNTQITQQQWTSASVTSMLIFLEAGDDSVNVSNSIKQSCAIGGGDGNDTLTGGGGNDSIGGGAGNDIMDGQGGADSMFGNGGNDTIDYSRRTGDLVVDVEDRAVRDGEKGENDDLYVDIRIILGGSGNDLIRGTTNSDFVLAGNGNDTVFGGGSDDAIYGGGGDDLLYGDSGRDKIYGDTGADRIFGGNGNDTIKGGKGRDRIYGQDGNDKLYDNDNAIDIIDGGTGTDGIDRDSEDNVYNIP